MTSFTTPAARWQAKWCWTRKHLPQPWNYYAYFRKAVKLAAEPRQCTVRVSADARYTLFVNGRRVHQGPARSFPAHQSYDTLDLSDFLEVGVNAICAIVHQFGVPTFFSQYRDASGFLLDGVIECEDDSIELHTPSGWTCKEAKAWRKDTARLTVQMGFQEHFDADVDPADWMMPEYAANPAEGWTEPWVAGPVGCHPWLYLEPRGVPLLTDHVDNFVSIEAQFKGENGRGYKIAPDVYQLMHSETRKREKNLIENAASLLTNDAEVAVISPATDSDFIMAVLDLGIYRTGHIILDIADASGDEIIDVLFSDDVDKEGFPTRPGGLPEPTVCEEATGFRYRCRPGPQCWESFQYLGLRYATLIFRNIVKPIKIRHVALRQVHAALEKIGAFECSDSQLNQIWDVARNTQMNCLFDAFVDCSAREQAQWWGDAHVQASVTAYAFGDLSFLERGIRQIAQSQASDGSLHAHPPADIPGHRLPDFMMTWVESLWDFYLYTGRTDLAKECLPTLHRVFDFLRRHESKNRLIGGFDGFWVFLDWAPIQKDDFSAMLNLMYLQSLRRAVSLCDLVGDAAGRQKYLATADLLAASIETHFWDETAQVFRDGFDPNGDISRAQISQHANCLAILLGLKPESHGKIAKEILVKPALARRSKVITASPFFYAFILEAIVKAGLHKEAVEIIGEKWGKYLTKGATAFWEMWDETGSRCHAWSASPLYLLSQILLGVRSIEPGWAKIQISPFTETLEFARGVVPTPSGPLRIEWEKSGDDQLVVRIDVPEGLTAEFVDQVGNRRRLTDGANQFHT